MGNLGLGFKESGQSVLARLRADILQACSEKNYGRLKTLLKDNKVATMTEDVETLLLTQDTLLECLRDAGNQASLPGQDKAKSHSHPGESPGFQCAGLILAVLLLRKLHRIKDIPSNGILIPLLWSCSPRFFFPELLNAMLDDESSMITWLDWHRNALRNEPDKDVACFWIAAAVLQYESLFCHQWTKPYLKNALFKSAYVVLSTISGDQAVLHRVFCSWGRYYFMKYVTYFLPYWLTLAQNIDKNNIETSMRAFEEYYRQASPSLDDFLSSILRLVCGDESKNPKDLWRRSDAKTDLVCAYASFFFDAECVSDDALQNMGECPWGALGNFLVMFNLESINQEACRLCFTAFEKLCQRGCAGLFLMALQNKDALKAIRKVDRGRLVLHLVKNHHTCQVRRQVLSTSCELCQLPIASFYVWMLNHSSLFDSFLDPMEIASYCPVNCLPLFRRMRKSGIRNICAMHEESKPDFSLLTLAIKILEDYEHKQGLGQGESIHGSQSLSTSTTESRSFETDVSICGDTS